MLYSHTQQFSTTQRYTYTHTHNNIVQHSAILSHTQQYSTTQRYTYAHTHTHTTIQYNSALYIHTNTTIQCSSSSNNQKKPTTKQRYTYKKKNDAAQHSVIYTDTKKTIQYNQRRIQYRRARPPPPLVWNLFVFWVACECITRICFNCSHHTIFTIFTLFSTLTTKA